jgi:hypothetical protein
VPATSRLAKTLEAALTSTWLLWVLLAGWLLYDKGLSDGARVFLSVGYLVALFCLGISVATGFLLRQPLLAGRARYLPPVVAVYACLAIALAWQELLFLTLVGAIGGLFVGAAVALSSRDGWR